MNLFQTPQKTSGYNTIPSIPNAIAYDDTAAVSLPLGTTLLSSSSTMMTMGRRLSKWRMIAMFAGMMMLVVAGGTVWMGDGGITTTSEGFVVATQGVVPCVPATNTFDMLVYYLKLYGGDGFNCEPATNTFGGVSNTATCNFIQIQKRNHRGEYSLGLFQTCYQS